MQLEVEMLEQPDALARVLADEKQNILNIAAQIRQRSPRFITFVARGSSDNAARYGQYVFGTLNALPTALATPSTTTVYGVEPQFGDSLVVAVSQSGQSPDIARIVETGRRQGAMTVAITNDVNSPLANASEHVINLQAGVEKAIAATKTYTSSLMALAMLSAALAGDDAKLNLLERIPEWAGATLGQLDATVSTVERYAYIQHCVVNSRGYNYAAAHEVALKIKELTYTVAEPYSSADFKHGPIALVNHGFPAIVVVPEGVLAPELIDLCQQLKTRGAELIVISPIDEALRLAHTPLPYPNHIPEWASPVIAVLQGQMIAYGLTLAKRLNPDEPRGITKVTLTL